MSVITRERAGMHAVLSETVVETAMEAAIMETMAPRLGRPGHHQHRACGGRRKQMCKA